MELSDITLFGIPLWKWLLIFALAYGAREAYRGWAENRSQRKEREEARRRFEGKNDCRPPWSPPRCRSARDLSLLSHSLSSHLRINYSFSRRQIIQ